jgi:hypothetical protein
MKTLTLATLLSLVNTLDDADCDSLSHVTNGETTKRRVFSVGLDTLRKVISLVTHKVE